MSTLEVRLFIHQVVGTVCDLTGADALNLVDKSRKPPLPYTRQLICWILLDNQRKIGMTQREISQLFNWKGHRMVIHARKKIKSLLQVDYSVRKDVNKIKETLLLSVTSGKP